MLYQVYENQRTLMEPFVDFAQAAAKLYGNTQTPLGQNPFAQRVAAGYSLIYRLGKDYEKPAFDIQAVNVEGTEVAIHERIELDKPFCELRRFKRFTDDPATLTRLKGQPAVLIVAPLSGHYATLLRDTVKTMLKDHKVYITDWKNARIVPLADGEFHLDDYVNYVQEFIRHLQGIYGNCHVISVCQPTVPVFAAISLMASRGETTPLSMTMMGGPIDARLSPTAVNNLAMNKSYEWFENNVIYRVPKNFPGAGRRVYPGFLQHTGFVAMNPDRHAKSHFDYFKDLLKGDGASAEAHRKFYDEYNAVLDMDADYYLETIKTVFQEFKLVNGTWDVLSVKGKPERVKPGDIRATAVMTIEGELDDISGSGQTRAALDMCTGIDAAHKKHMEVKGAGHYGIFSGRRWRDAVYPVLKTFILEANAGLAQAPSARVAPKKIAVQAKAAPAKTTRAKASAAAMPAAQAASKASLRSVAKPAAQPAAKTVAKPVTKPATTPATKAATKPVKAAAKAAVDAVAQALPPATPSGVKAKGNAKNKATDETVGTATAKAGAKVASKASKAPVVPAKRAARAAGAAGTTTTVSSGPAAPAATPASSAQPSAPATTSSNTEAPELRTVGSAEVLK